MTALRKLGRFAAYAFFYAAATILLVFLVEGGASVVYAIHSALPPKPDKPLAERLHTRYDSGLGWVNLPNVYLPNMYGRGKYLRINSLGFRSNEDFTTAEAPHKTRIICSGDSFTLGYGVDNDHTWPQLLASHAGNIQTVNMGQGGYGADQAYLWYKRDGANLDHGIHIFASISDDFRRMQFDLFGGYAKPVLAIENDRLVVRNVPVPRSAVEPVFARAKDAMAKLSAIRMLRTVLRLDAAAAAAHARAQDKTDEETFRVAGKMFDDLIEKNRAKNSVLVLVYFPLRREYDADGPEIIVRKFLADYARQRGILFLDLVGDFRRTVPEQVDKLYIEKGAIDFPGAAGHFTDEGNAFVADLIYRRLLANPETAAKLR